MNHHDFSEYTEYLLHCVHADNEVGANNALLQYCGLGILGQVAHENLSPGEFNGACWALRERIEKPPIRIIKADPINAPSSKIPGIFSVLALPNTTTLNSSSHMLKQAQSQFSSKLTSSDSSLGCVVHSDIVDSRYYDSLWHLVCRNPGDPSIHKLSSCFEELAWGAPIFLHVPIFGKVEEAGQWASAIAVWLSCRQNIQRAGTFIDMYFIDKSEDVAREISNSLNQLGIQHVLDR